MGFVSLRSSSSISPPNDINTDIPQELRGILQGETLERAQRGVSDIVRLINEGQTAAQRAGRNFTERDISNIVATIWAPATEGIIDPNHLTVISWYQFNKLVKEGVLSGSYPAVLYRTQVNGITRYVVYDPNSRLYMANFDASGNFSRGIFRTAADLAQIGVRPDELEIVGRVARDLSPEEINVITGNGSWNQPLLDEVRSRLRLLPDTILKIFDTGGEPLISQESFLAFPWRRSGDLHLEQVKPEQVIAITRGVMDSQEGRLTVEDFEELMRSGNFDFDNPDRTWFGYKFPDGRVVVLGGRHRTVAAIRQGKTFNMWLEDVDPRIWSIRSERTREIIAERIANGLINGEIRYDSDGTPFLYLRSLASFDLSAFLFDRELLQNLIMNSDRRQFREILETLLIEKLPPDVSEKSIREILTRFGYSGDELNKGIMRILKELSTLSIKTEVGFKRIAGNARQKIFQHYLGSDTDFEGRFLSPNDEQLLNSIVEARRQLELTRQSLALKMGAEYFPPSNEEIEASIADFFIRIRKNFLSQLQNGELRVSPSEDKRGVQVETRYSSQLFSFGGETGLIVRTRIESPVGEDMVRLYRGVGAFDPQITQKAAILRSSGITQTDIDAFLAGEIELDELVSRSHNYRDSLLADIAMIRRLHPEYSDLEILVTLHKNYSRGQKGWSADIFLSTTIDPLIAYRFSLDTLPLDTEIRGLSGVLVIEIPRSKVVDLNAEYGERLSAIPSEEREFLIPGELDDRWIVGFIPVTPGIEEEVFSRQLNKFEKLRSQSLQ